MKLLPLITVGIILFASQANASTAQPVDNRFLQSDMKTCYGKLNELKKFNPAESHALNKKLMTVVQSRASLNASGQYASSETMAYIMSLQSQTISGLCMQITQKLDVEMMKKTISSLKY